ncbi:hypothetical protein ASZ78_001985 [Callipepla squamata]|uniref:PHF7/G2E3-like PHD zinc finger domain-containing protein n=1 Tax=Callipepla squamata TaxID=9009 RepID=A0A226MK62_CALSU|nr:hypothetical protein ASZ78_001985 [Callipepla squamata]
MEAVEERLSFNTLTCPACNTAHFHRYCVQRQARIAGQHRFHCLFCWDVENIRTEMFRLGIQIPSMPWRLLLCRSCGSRGTHRFCSTVTDSSDSWECANCVDTDSGKKRCPRRDVAIRPRERSSRLEPRWAPRCAPELICVHLAASSD